MTTITAKIIDQIEYVTEMETCDVDFYEFFADASVKTWMDRAEVRETFDRLMSLRILKDELLEGKHPSSRTLFNDLLQQVMEWEVDDASYASNVKDTEEARQAALNEVK